MNQCCPEGANLRRHLTVRLDSTLEDQARRVWICFPERMADCAWERKVGKEQGEEILYEGRVVIY